MTVPSPKITTSQQTASVTPRDETVDHFASSSVTLDDEPLQRPGPSCASSGREETTAPPRPPMMSTPPKSQVAAAVMSFLLPRSRADDEELLSRVPAYATVGTAAARKI